MFEVAKDGERQRRLKLRKHLQVSVLQKHAAAFQRAQQLHTDALEQCMKAEGNTVDDSSEKADGKDKETKKKNKPPIKTVMTVKEHIEHVANVLGSTVVWDNPQEDVVVVDVEKEAKASPAMVSVDDEESGGFDVDGYADCSSDEEDLPLLADAEDLKAQQEKQLKSTIEKESSKTAKPERKKKSKGRRSKSRSRSKRAADSLKKITGLILLDQESLDQSFFMDRVLYSGSLIESPFVLFAGVAILENDRPDLVVLESSLDSSERTQTLKQKITLVIVTKDLVLHLFDIPCERETITETANEIDGVDPRLTAASSQDVFVPGSPPTSALRFLLRRFEIADMLRKQQNVLCSDTDAPASTSKLSFRRSKPVKEKVPLFQFQFQHLRPSLSFPLAQSNVRFYKRGENAVNISPRSDQSLQFFAKLSFGSTNDQQAFVEACQFQDGNVQ